MLDKVLQKAGEGVGNAVGPTAEGAASGYLDFMLSPWGLIVLVVVFLLIRRIR